MSDHASAVAAVVSLELEVTRRRVRGRHSRERNRIVGVVGNDRVVGFQLPGATLFRVVAEEYSTNLAKANSLIRLQMLDIRCN
jgi:hypothetical protein